MSGIFGTTEKQTVDDPIDILQPGAQPNVRFGFNGNLAYASRNFSDPEFRDRTARAHPKLIRYPGGGSSDTFNILTEAYATGVENKLSDIKLLVDEAGVDIIFVLNMVQFDLADNMIWLKKANAMGIKVGTIEMGNEINNRSSDGRKKYPTAYEYANTCARWIPEIKKTFPNAQFICVGENKGYASDVRVWNNIVRNAVLPVCPNLLLAWHVYPNPDYYVTNGIVDFAKLEAVIMKDYRETGFDKLEHFAVTEFNTKNSDKEGSTAPINDDQQAKAIVFIADKLRSLGATILCLHNIEGKIGVFGITKTEIKLLPSGIGFENIIQ